jgi:hypothetical protein
MRMRIERSMTRPSASDGHVLDARHQQQAGLLQPDLLLELDRAERRDRLEVAVKGRRAHSARTGELLHPERLGVMVGDPPDGVADLREAAVGEGDLPHRLPQRAVQQPPEDLLLDQGREHAPVPGLAGQPHHPQRRVQGFLITAGVVLLALVVARS